MRGLDATALDTLLERVERTWSDPSGSVSLEDCLTQAGASGALVEELVTMASSTSLTPEMRARLVRALVEMTKRNHTLVEGARSAMRVIEEQLAALAEARAAARGYRGPTESGAGSVLCRA